MTVILTEVRSNLTVILHSFPAKDVEYFSAIYISSFEKMFSSFVNWIINWIIYSFDVCSSLYILDFNPLSDE
jgi:hypothetical protein